MTTDDDDDDDDHDDEEAGGADGAGDEDACFLPPDMLFPEPLVPCRSGRATSGAHGCAWLRCRGRAPPQLAVSAPPCIVMSETRWPVRLCARQGIAPPCKPIGRTTTLGPERCRGHGSPRSWQSHRPVTLVAVDDTLRGGRPNGQRADCSCLYGLAHFPRRQNPSTIAAGASHPPQRSRALRQRDIQGLAGPLGFNQSVNAFACHIHPEIN